MKLLLTNDDGFEAPGLAALEGLVARNGWELVIVAPHEHLSGCSHQATTDRPIRVKEIGAARYCVGGTPVDCVRLGLLELAPDVDWVLSGINDGGNLGVDVLMSGTVAAAREAALLGRPAIALSQFRSDRSASWEDSQAMTGHTVERLWKEPLGKLAFWNVNLPDIPGGSTQMARCPLDPGPLPLRYDRDGEHRMYRGAYQQRPQAPRSDVQHCFSGKITVSQVAVFPPS